MIDPNAMMSAAGEGAKAVSRFEEIIQKIWGPKWTKKQADADAYADERKLQTIRDNPDMEIVFTNGQMNARARTPEELAERARQRQLAQSIKQEENLENIIEIAENDIQMKEEFSDDPVDEDWIIRFFSDAQFICDTEMQIIWGKILAGEITRPGSFSYRTLSIVRNVNRSEAEAFQSLIPLVLRCPGSKDKSSEDYFVLADYFNDYHSIEYCVLQRLEEAGFLSLNSSIMIDFIIEPGDTEQIHASNKSIKINNTQDSIIRITHPGFFLTAAARELYSLLSPELTSTDEYLNEAINLIKKENLQGKIPDSVVFDVV